MNQVVEEITALFGPGVVTNCDNEYTAVYQLGSVCETIGIFTQEKRYGTFTRKKRISKLLKRKVGKASFITLKELHIIVSSQCDKQKVRGEGRKEKLQKLIKLEERLSYWLRVTKTKPIHTHSRCGVKREGTKVTLISGGKSVTEDYEDIDEAKNIMDMYGILIKLSTLG